MGIQKATSGLMKHSLSGKELYKQNALGVKIRDLDNDKNLKDTVRYCLVLSGIKKENLPSDAQKMVLFDFIKDTLGTYTLDEVRTAFKLAVSQKLTVKGESYQNFSCGFFSGVMRAYDLYIRNIGFKREKLNEEKVQIDYGKQEREMMSTLDSMIKNSIEKSENLFKNNGLDVSGSYDTVCSIAYRYRAKDTCDLSKDDKIRIFKDSCNEVLEYNDNDNECLYLQQFIRIIDGKTKDKSNKYFKMAVVISERKAFEIWLQSKFKNK